MTIYVLRSRHLIKIGFTDSLRARLSAYRSMVPTDVEFVGHMPGDMAVEQHFHNRFAEHHFSGEWFVETDKIRDVFAAILDPELPSPSSAKTKKRRDTTDISGISKRVKSRSAELWPAENVGGRIGRVADVLGWTKNRVRDLFYSDSRIAIRASEKEQLELWLATAPRNQEEMR